MTTLESAAEVLRCFSPDRTELTVTETAALLELPKSTTSRLLRSMLAAGFLETIGESRRYRPGALVLGLSRSYRTSSVLFRQVDAAIADIVKQVGHTGYVSIRNGVEVVGLTDHPGSNALSVSPQLGRPLPAHSTATGRALLARIPDDAVRELFPHGWEPPSTSAPQSIDELLDRLALVRSQGFAESKDEAVRGVGVVAAAVGTQDDEALAMCISYPLATVSDDEVQALRELMLTRTEEIADLVGDQFRRTES
ncbi:MAG: helix-turn-helix domain-containing protein [Streptosporangiales bacterium]|nr:helix-turn-helix domain-containing protein [Streptosporangiales bacterium]